MCSIFPFQNDLLGCGFSIQGLFNKIPVLFLQIQEVFKEKSHFQGACQRPSSFSRSIPGPCEPIDRDMSSRRKFDPYKLALYQSIPTGQRETDPFQFRVLFSFRYIFL